MSDPTDALDASGVEIREYRPGDDDELRALWLASGFRLAGDDDSGMARFADRNPDLFLVATAGGRTVGSAMGAWDGRRGWIYHVATVAEYRRSGIASRLVRQVEAGLRALGAPRINVIVRDGNDAGREFWSAAGYELVPSRQFGKDLRDDLRMPGGHG